MRGRRSKGDNSLWLNSLRTPLPWRRSLCYELALKYHSSPEGQGKYLTVQPSDFQSDRAGRPRRASGGYWTFVPNPLPPAIALEPKLIESLTLAERSLGILAGVGTTLPNPYLLIGPFVRREAVLSSRIEGTEASLSDLFLYEAAPGAASRGGDVREVANHVRALELGLSPERPVPVSLRLIRDLHRTLMDGVRGGERTPGEFRTSQNWIGPPGANLEQALFVPPAVPEMHEALAAFEDYLRASGGLPFLVRLALLHYQFEAIHPFVDGNGRVGRLLIPLLLSEHRRLPSPLLCLSAFFERQREEYYARLLAVSRHGDWESWIAYFLRGVAEQSLDAVARAGKLRALEKEYERRLQTARSSALLLKLVQALFHVPALTIAKAARRLCVTPAAAAKSVSKLVQSGILEEATGRARNRVFVAREIVRAVEEDLSPAATSASERAPVGSAGVSPP